MRAVLLPRTVSEVWDALEHEPKAALYAGGTDLLVLMRSGRVNPSALVCLERVDELREIRDEGGALVIGAAATHSSVMEHPAVKTLFPVLVQALKVLGSPHVRHAGTVGGNIITASPSGDTLPALYCLGAELELSSPSESRRVPIPDFMKGPGRVALKERELLIGIRIPKTPAWSIQRYEKVGKRKAQACAVVSLAALVNHDTTGCVTDARLAWGGVGATVMRSPIIDRAMEGITLSLDALSRIATMARDIVKPIDDIRAAADYRRMAAGNLVMRLTAPNQRDGRSPHSLIGRL